MSTLERHVADGVPTLCLRGALTIAEAAPVREALREQLALDAAGHPELRLDLTGIDELDSAGVQLLLSAARTLQAQSRRARLEAAAPLVERVAAALGAGDERHCCGFERPPGAAS
jgi:anti-anti-sigma factor